jgi:hypothetical protein
MDGLRSKGYTVWSMALANISSLTETTNWRAGCGKSASPVRREGWRSNRHPYLYSVELPGQNFQAPYRSGICDTKSATGNSLIHEKRPRVTRRSLLCPPRLGRTRSPMPPLDGARNLIWLWVLQIFRSSGAEKKDEGPKGRPAFSMVGSRILVGRVTPCAPSQQGRCFLN